MAQAALDAAIAYAAERRAFGKPIREFQAVSHRLAEMATRVDAARLLVYRAAAILDAGERRDEGGRDGQALRDRGRAAGDRRGDPGPRRGRARARPLLERLYREVRATRIYEGTSEIQREIIARELFGSA